jgi:NAD-dependent dihydropyrimidine dehydrogenase PreA subunit
MALFIEIVVADELRERPEQVAKLVEVCPVDIFRGTSVGLDIVDENVDECTLCELCLEVGRPGQVEVLKLYDGSAPLQRSV